MAANGVFLRGAVFRPTSCPAVRNMATLKDISMRLKSVKNIQKITKSMKMVSAAKFGKAERELRPARVYGAGASALYEKVEIEPSEVDKTKPNNLTPRDYPKKAPNITCLMQIYHPNIDDNGIVCLNLFSREWTETHTLEDCVQGLLFLLYNPNLDDPNNPFFDREYDNNFDDFTENVRLWIEGAFNMFERNENESDEDNQDF